MRARGLRPSSFAPRAQSITRRQLRAEQATCGGGRARRQRARPPAHTLRPADGRAAVGKLSPARLRGRRGNKPKVPYKLVGRTRTVAAALVGVSVAVVGAAVVVVLARALQATNNTCTTHSGRARAEGAARLFVCPFGSLSAPAATFSPARAAGAQLAGRKWAAPRHCGSPMARTCVLPIAHTRTRRLLVTPFRARAIG